MVDVGHEQFAAGVIVGLEADGAAYDIGIALHQPTAVEADKPGLVQVERHFTGNVADRLFHAEQYVVNVPHGALQRLLGIQLGLTMQRLA